MGNPFVFIHGWATDFRAWMSSVTAFDDASTMDLPAHGARTPWTRPTLDEPVAELMNFIEGPENQDAKKIVAVGWSLGAETIIEAAAENPERFEALILIGATPSFVARDDFPHGKSPALVKRMIEDIRKNPQETLNRFYRLNFTEEELKKKEAEEFLSTYEDAPPLFDTDGIVMALETLLKMDLRERLKDIKTPTLVVHGRHDAVVPVEAGDFLTDNIKGAHMCTFEDAGHAPFITTPAYFNRLIEEFLKRTKR